VKRICSDCQTSYEPNEKEKALLGLEDGEVIYRGQGCNACNHTGYRGRTGIHEILPIYDSIKTMIDERKPIESIRQQAMQSGMITLRQSCRQLVLNGTTTVEELLRMTYSLE